MRKSLVLAATLVLAFSALTSADALAAQCRDAKGKFIKCPVAAAAPATKCRDMKTKKFAKCGVPGTEPVPMTAKAK